MSEFDQRPYGYPGQGGYYEQPDNQGQGETQYYDRWGRPYPPPSHAEPYTRPIYAQAPLAQPPYQQDPYAQPQYGQAQYAQTQYAPPSQPFYAQPAYPQPPVRRHRPVRAFSLAVVAVAVAVVAGLGIGHLVSGPGTPVSAGNQNFGYTGNPGTSDSSRTALDVAAVSSKVNPAIVNVNTQLGLQGAAAAGTGIVLTPDGEVLTNNHVVEGATSIKVTDIGDGKTYTAAVLGYDRSHDIAVIQLSRASGLATATIGDSSTVKVGDAIVGLGNAGGRGGTPVPAPGTVTALDQSITASDESSGSSEQLTGLIQVAAEIQSGDSGGPLVNAGGQVVGVDTAASTGYQLNGRRSGGSSGAQGFAIPISQAIDLAHQIIAGSASDTVHIGKTAFLGVSVADSQGQGAQVRQLVAGGPAGKAGLAEGDVITAINGKAVTSATTLTAVMDTHHPGDRLTLTVADASGAQQSISVTATEGPVG